MDIKPVEVKNELADKNVKFIADINVLDGNNVVKISNTKMKIKIALPEALKGYDKYEVVYILNDEIKETIPATVEDGYIVFETNHLSQYGIIATNTANGTKSPTTPAAAPTSSTNPAAPSAVYSSNNTVTSPKTGYNDDIALWLASMLVFCGVAGGLAYNKYRKVKK